MLNFVFQSKWFKDAISKLISKKIRKDTNCDMQLYINEFDAREITRDHIRIRVDAEMTIKSSEIEKWLNELVAKE